MPSLVSGYLTGGRVRGTGDGWVRTRRPEPGVLAVGVVAARLILNQQLLFVLHSDTPLLIADSQTVDRQS